MSQETVEVPIAGKIISVEVAVGDEVEDGDTICMLESMKMENPIISPADGTIVKIEVVAGQVVQPGDTIAVVEC